MTESLLPSVDILTGPAPTHAVIWLHGLGADGHDFEPVVDEFDADRLPPTRFIFPHAPKRAVTINAGYVMRAWFDIYSRDYGNRAEDVEGTEASAAQVEALIARENARGIPDERIVLAQKALVTREESFRIMRRRAEVGSSSDLELRQVESLLLNTRGELAAWMRARIKRILRCLNCLSRSPMASVTTAPVLTYRPPSRC